MVQQVPPERVLEIGNVLSHYFPTRHDIVDKFEQAPGVKNVDVVDFRPTQSYDLIVSISTLEHVGFNEKRLEPEKPARAIRHLQRCLSPRARLVITIPMGFNPHLDRMLQEGRIPLDDPLCFRRISADNRWREASWEDIRAAKYGHPYRNANAGPTLGRYCMSIDRRSFVARVAALAASRAVRPTQTPKPSDPLGVRADFPIVAERAYLNSAYIAPMPRSVVAAGTEFLHNKSTRPLEVGELLGTCEAVRRQFARLVNATADEIGLLFSTAEGENVIAQGLDLVAGDNVVVDELHYPTEFVLYRALEASRGIKLRIAKHRDGVVDASDFAPLIDRRTRIVSVAWVSHQNGFRHDMRPIAPGSVSPPSSSATSSTIASASIASGSFRSIGSCRITTSSSRRRPGDSTTAAARSAPRGS